MATEAVTAQSIGAAEAEADLVRRLQVGDQAAHGDLAARFGSALHRYAASRLLGDQELAEDVMVHTLVDALRDIRRFNPRRATLSAWLYGIARRHIGAQRRKQNRRKAVPSSARVPIDTVLDLPAAGDMETAVAARLDAQRQVLELSRVLSDAEMEVLVLHWVHELSAREIGRIVGRSHRAVESMLHRAKAKAREEVQDHGD